nr:hypothetical protein [Tanacetum cinerariifolium]
MIFEPGDADHEVPVNPTFHEQSDDELTEKELNYETVQEIWLRVQQMMKLFGPDLPSSSTFKQQPLPNNNYNPQPSFNQNYMKQPMPNSKDITDPTATMNMTLVLLAKAFKLNYFTPTNNNKRISSNPRNRQIA